MIKRFFNKSEDTEPPTDTDALREFMESKLTYGELVILQRIDELKKLIEKGK